MSPVWWGLHETFNKSTSRNTGGGRRSPAVACWASDHWVASSNPLGWGGGQVSSLISPLNLNISNQIVSLFDMYMDMGERIAGKQDRPSLIIEDPLRAP